MSVCKTTKDCRHVYRQILQGYTHVEEKNLYIKHFNESDLGYLDSFYKKCEKEIRDKGIDSSKEKLEFLKKEGYWTEEDEIEYLNARAAVNDAHEFQSKLQDDKQKESFNEEINRVSSILQKISETRRVVLNPTIESFCDKRINEQYVRIALFEEPDCGTTCYSEEKFSELSYIELGELVKTYNDAVSWFDDLNIKKVAVNGFFLNAFLMSNNDPVKFYGKNVIELTSYQLNLFGKGKFYKSILEEGKEPPDAFYENIDQNGLDPIVAWFDAAYAQIKTERAARDAKTRSRNAGRR